MKLLYVLSWFHLLFFLASCKTHQKTTECQDATFFNSALQIENNQEIVQRDTFFNALGLSDYGRGEEFAKNNKIITDSGDKGFIYLIPKEVVTKKEYYLFYRLLELKKYLSNEHKRALLNVLTKAYSVSSGVDSQENTCVNKLLEIEFTFISFYNQNDSVNQRKSINKIYEFLKDYPNSLRIKFLWAQMNYGLQNINIAFPIFYDLISKKYYEKTILNTLIEYYKNINSDSLKYYTKVKSKLFPAECNLGAALISLKDSAEYTFLFECEKCLGIPRSNDSIVARLFLAQYYLEKRDLNKVDKIYDSYFRNNQEFILDDFKIWERGQYYDIKLQNLFLQRRYMSMYEFIIKDVGYNELIKINSELDFKNLIERYYHIYFNSNSEDFEIFFKKYFSVTLVFPSVANSLSYLDIAV